MIIYVTIYILCVVVRLPNAALKQLDYIKKYYKYGR